MKHSSTSNPSSARRALASPFRLELLGLFAGESGLSVSDMARLTGRPATSLYHHLRVLEEAGILAESGTRPKGKRFESVYEVVESRLELELEAGDPQSGNELVRTMRSALRMAERDFVAAIEREDLVDEGPARNCVGLRMHVRASPEFLAALNERLLAIDALLAGHAHQEPGPEDQFISLTYALLPLRGRSVDPVNPTNAGDAHD